MFTTRKMPAWDDKNFSAQQRAEMKKIFLFSSSFFGGELANWSARMTLFEVKMENDLGKSGKIFSFFKFRHISSSLLTPASFN